jgi:alpha-galactosidase
VVLDKNEGILRGRTPSVDGKYTVILTAENKYGRDTRELTLVVGNTLALTPPMGWNHWYTHYHFVTGSNIRNAAKAMVESGMADVGYSYVSIDDCWMRISPEYVERAMKRKRTGNVNLDTAARMGIPRDDTGKIIPNDAFPDMAALTDYIHDFGLKAGIYTSPGPRTCQEFEGSWQHEAIDAMTYAGWGFDLLKYDWCRYGEIFSALPESQRTLGEYIKPYEIMGDLLKQQRRDIVHNLCQYGMAKVWTWGKQVGHSWRTGGDLGHTITQGGIYKTAKKTIEIREYNGPGGWNDPDYLIMGQWRSPFDKGADLSQINLTPNEQYSYMSLWCMMASPLFFSGDMDELDDFTLNVLTNTELIAVNQDVKGTCAEPVRMDEMEWVLRKELADGSVVVGLFDVFNAGDRSIQVTWDELGLAGRQLVRDLWRQKVVGYAEDSLTVNVGPRGCAVLGFFR